MKFTGPGVVLAALASIMTPASAAPTESVTTPKSIPESGVVWTPSPHKTTNSSTNTSGGANRFAIAAINDCGDSTFINQSSGGSPLVADCWRLHDNIAGDGTWTVWTSQRTIATYGTCAFGVSPMYSPAEIGNGDVRDLIRDSIARFQWFDKVGAKGVMHCERPLGDWTEVEWGIYHT